MDNKTVHWHYFQYKNRNRKRNPGDCDKLIQNQIDNVFHTTGKLNDINEIKSLENTTETCNYVYWSLQFFS